MKKKKPKLAVSQVAASPLKGTGLAYKLYPVPLHVFAEQAMKEYGTYTIENRALPDFRDGLKPVQRRILWEFYYEGRWPNKPYAKSAKSVGNVMANYHPHGDASIYGAMVTMAQELSPVQMVDGQGNWGGLFGENAAAPRYTECRMSQYTADVLVNKDYMPVAELIPSYDGSKTEPVYLPSLLPNILINGSFGIATGTATHIPPFAIEGILKVLRVALTKDKPVTARMCSKFLEFAYKGGSTCVSDDADILSYFQNGTGPLQFSPDYVIDEKNPRKIVLVTYPPFFDPDKAMKKLFDKAPSVSDVRDETGREGPRISVYLKADTPLKSVEKIAEEVCDLLTTTVGLRTNLTIRGVQRTTNEETGKEVVFEDIQFAEWTIPRLFNKWIEYRVDLEIRYLNYYIAKAVERIRILKLLIFAFSKLDIIFKVLKEKSTVDINLRLSKALKINLEDAKTILDRSVRSLSHLSKGDLEKQLKEQETEVLRLRKHLKAPQEKIATELNNFDPSIFVAINHAPPKKVKTKRAA